MPRRTKQEIEAEIEELRARWPAHSVPPALMSVLDSLEAELEALQVDDPEEENDA